MITKVKQNFTSLIYSELKDDKFAKLSKPRKFFIAHILWLFATVKGKINFLQLKRFSNNCEQYFSPELDSGSKTSLIFSTLI